MLPVVFVVLFELSIAYLAFGIYILIKSWNSLTNRIFFSLCIHLSLWAFGYAFMTVAPDIEAANFWRLVAALGWCFVYSVWLDFAVLVKSQSKKWMTDIRRLLMYIPGVFFFIGNLRYRPEQIMERSGFVWVDMYPTNYFEILFMVFYTSFAAAGVLIIYKWGKASEIKREKKQAGIIVKTAMASFIAGAFTDTILPLLGMDIFPMGIIMLSLVLLGMKQAITKYKMMSLTSEVAHDYVLSTVNDPVIIIGKDLQVKEANSAAFQLTGFTEMEMKGLPIDALIEAKKPNKAAQKSLLNGGEIRNIEVGLLTKNKNSLPCLFSGSAIKDGLGEILGTACIFHDITDRKNAELQLLRSYQELESKVRERTIELEEINALLKEEIYECSKAEEELKSSEEKFKAFIMQSSEGIIVIDQDTGSIVESNGEARKILGLTEMKMQEPIDGQLTLELKEAIHKLIDWKALKKYKYKKGVTKYTLRNNVNRDIEYTASLVGYSNKQFIMVVFNDITEKIKLEERKRQLVKMESLGTLSGGIAHDFNNILAGIIGYTQLTLEDMDEAAPSSENLAEVLKLGERAKKLISQILTFSRKTYIMPEIVDFKAVIDEVIKLLIATLPANIDIRCSSGDDATYVYADPGELHQLVMNLCVNARLAMDRTGGTLGVKLEEAVIEQETEIDYQLLKPGSYAVLKVIDSGCGMEESIIKRIFEPFFTTRDVQGGTGLGLSVVHGIVNRYGGVIKVESEPDKGSIFTVFLPSTRNSSNKAVIPDKTGNKSAARILLVDDEESIVNTVQKLLQRQGYAVEGVLSARKALKLFRENEDSFDLVITDRSMPDMSGDSLVEELRAIKPKIPVVVCSGYSSRESSEGSDSTCAIEYLSKPVAKREYINTIERLLKYKQL